MSDTSQNGLSSFRLRVLSDPALQARLRGLPDRATFVARVVLTGAELGYVFTIQDVQQAMQETRRNFLVGQKRILPWMYAI